GERAGMTCGRESVYCDLRGGAHARAATRDRPGHPGRLVSCLGDPMTKSGDAGEDFISRLGPDKRAGSLVRHRDVLADRSFKGPGAGMGAAFDLLLGQGSEPTLDEIEPGGTGRREVHAEAWPPREPPANQRGLVGAVVVQDEMHVQVGRHGTVDRVE